MRSDSSFDPLLELIVCPACHGRLLQETTEAKLVCTSCGRGYPVEDGLPVLLTERAAMTRR